MKTKNVSVKLLSVLLAVTLLFAVFAPAVMAAVGDHNHKAATKKEDLHYVSLGDSMTNGYGLDGYNHNSGVADYGDKSYANIFEEYLGKVTTGNVTHAQLAMSGIRTEDIHWLLELDYNNPEVIAVLNEFVTENNKKNEVWDQAKWNEYFSCGDYWTVNEIINHSRINATFAHIAGMTDYETYTGCEDHKKLVEFPETVADKGTSYNSYTMAEKIAVIAKYYQENVAKADVITLSVGNGNLGVFGFGRILEVIGFQEGETYKNYNYEDVLRECEPEMKARVMELLDELKPTLEQYVANPDLVNVMLYIAVSLVLNYAGTLDAILQMNSDVEIVLLPVMNTFGDNLEKVEGEITIGDLLGLVIDPLNKFISTLPTYMQVTQNGVYEDATFYWATPDEYIQCMVDTYAFPLTNPIVRSRFVESIVGYCKHGTKCVDNPECDKTHGDDYNDCDCLADCNEWSTGMIWGMLEDTGLVVRITLAEIEAYEALGDAGKLEYAAADAKKATSISMYLAFEKAIVTGKDNPVTLTSVFGLMDILGNDPFGKIMTDFAEAAAIAGATKLDTVATFVATASDLLTADQVKTLTGATEETFDEIKFGILAGIASGMAQTLLEMDVTLTAEQVKALINEETKMATIYALVAGFSGGLLTANDVETLCTVDGDDAVYKVAAGKSGGLLTANNVATLYISGDAAIFELIAERSGDALDAATVEYLYSNTLDTNIVDTVNTIKTLVGAVDLIKDKRSEVVSKVDTVKSVVPQLKDGADAMDAIPATVASLCTLLVMPETLGDTVANSELKGLLALFARCVIGNGLGAHPSEVGHATLAEAVISAYDEDYTAQKETIENLKILLELAKEYYDEAYAIAYDEAVKAGVIDDINGYLDLATKAINDAEAEVMKAEAYFRSEAFANEVKAAFEQARKTVRSAQTLVNNADELDAESYAYLLALLGDILTDVDNISDLVAIAVVDLGHYADPYIAEMNAQAEKQIEILNAQAEKQIAILNAQAEKQLAILNEKLMEAVGEAKEAIRAEIERVKTELNNAVEAVKTELNNAVEAVKAHAKEKIDALTTQINKQITTVQNAIIDLQNTVADAVNNTITVVTDIITNANNYFKENLPEAYKALVDLLLAQVPKVDAYLYDWFYNNPDVVIGFFNEYGDDMIAFFVENADVIIPVLAYIIYTFGDDVAIYVFENADVLLPAFVSWYETYGDRIWAILDVYLTALGVDTSIFTPEGLLGLLGDLFTLIGDLGKEFASDAWDQLVATGIIDEILSTIDEIKTQAWDQLVYLKETVKGQIEYQLGVLYGELAKLEAQLDKAIADANQALINQLNAAIQKVKAAIAALEEQLAKLDAMIIELNAAVEKLIDTIIKIENTVRGIIDAIENAVDLDKLNQILKDSISDLADLIIEAIDAAGLVDKIQTAIKILLEEGFDAMVEYLKALGIEAATQVAEALKALISDAATELGVFLAPYVAELAEKLNTAIKNFIDDALHSDYLITEDSNYLAIGSDIDGFAGLLADRLNLSDDAFHAIDWNAITPDAVVKADLITISFNENMLSGFAVEQTQGFLNAYVTETLKPSLNAYVVKAFTEFFAQMVPTPSADMVNEMIGMVLAMLNVTVDDVAGTYLGDATVTEMDWAALVGEDNVKYVDEAREAMRNELVSAGVPAVAPITIPVLDLFYANIDAFGDAADYIKGFEKEQIYAMFGENAEYTVYVPVLDALVFAGESYAYGYAQFTKTYATTVSTIAQLNPTATVVLLGHYNAFNGVVLGDVDLGALYGEFAKVTSAHPFAHALLNSNAIYVDIFDAETVYAAYAATADLTAVDFLMAYLADPTITNVSEAGNAYIYTQIATALGIYCAHEFDNACDADCNLCGYIRDVACLDEDADHICDICGEVLSECEDADKDHVCDYCDAVLSECEDADKDHVCDYCETVLGECVDADKDHVCDYCETVLGECADTNKDHKCDYCEAVLSECEDTNKDHKCDYCEAVLGECGDENKDHKCDICGETFSECADENKDHKCDICGETFSECGDENKDHKCDICGETFSECADENKDHKCDTCGEILSNCKDADYNHKCDDCGGVVSECKDSDKNHICDICGEVASECVDADKDHKCDICETVLGECADDNKDHKCDYCEAVLSECTDTNKDHKCDYCGETSSECADENNNHKCDICGEVLTQCTNEDAATDHKCDICGSVVSDCVDTNKDHKCDICGEIISACVDTDNNHKCDICDKVVSKCVDESGDHKCDVCGEEISACADNNKDHKCDTCDKVLSECADTDKDHACDTCDKTLTTCVDEDKDGKCDSCGKKVTSAGNSNVEEEEETSTAVIVAIICGSVVATAGVGFVLVRFVFKKKFF